MMSAREIDCAYVDQHDVAALYLGRALPDAEAAAFEAHYLSCQRCWDAVERIGEIRVALDQPFLVRKAAKHRDWLTPLAAAAVVAVIAIGLQRVSRPVPTTAPPAYRGTTTSNVFVVTARSARSGEFLIEWSVQPGAATYVLKLTASDGTKIMTSETAETRIALDVGALPPRDPALSILARVEAVDATGLIVARSALVRVGED